VVAQYLRQRRAGLCTSLREFAELRCLGDAEAQPQSEDDQHRAREQRHAPAPVREFLVTHEFRSERDHAGGDQCADRRPHLRERPIAAMLVLLAVFQ
jgi:hypothetical protein